MPAKQVRISYPGIRDRIELKPLDWSSAPSVSVRVSEIVQVNGAWQIIVSAPDVLARGPYDIGKLLSMSYRLPVGMIEAVTKVIASDEEDKVRTWTLAEPQKVRLTQRREEQRVSVFLPVEFDVVQEAVSERRVHTLSGSIIDLSPTGCCIHYRGDTGARVSTNTKVYLRFGLPEYGPLGEVMATIVRVKKEKVLASILTQFSVLFQKMPKAASPLLVKYCERREKFLSERGER